MLWDRGSAKERTLAPAVVMYCQLSVSDYLGGLTKKSNSAKNEGRLLEAEFNGGEQVLSLFALKKTLKCLLTIEKSGTSKILNASGESVNLFFCLFFTDPF